MVLQGLSPHIYEVDNDNKALLDELEYKMAYDLPSISRETSYVCSDCKLKGKSVLCFRLHKFPHAPDCENYVCQVLQIMGEALDELGIE